MKLVIFGISNFADMMHYWFTHDSDYDVVAFTVDKDYMENETYKGLPVVPFEDLENIYEPDEYHLYVAVGMQQINHERAQKVEEAKNKGYTLAHYLSSTANTHPDLVMTPNSAVMDACCLHPFVTIGENVVLWSTTRIAMKSHIGSHSWLVASLSGEQVAIGDYTFIGLGATIAPGVKIGSKSIIGAGSLILHDVPEESIVRGQESKISKVPSTRLHRI